MLNLNLFMENMKIRHRNMNTQDNSIGNLESIEYLWLFDKVEDSASRPIGVG